MDCSILLELLPIPDVISDGIMVIELYDLSKENNSQDGNKVIQTKDLFVASLVFFIFSIVVNILRFGWKFHMEKKHVGNDLLRSPHYRQTLRTTYFLTTLLEDIPQFIITIIYVNRQLEVKPGEMLTFAQAFSLITGMATLFTCGLTQEYLHNCTKMSVRDNVCLPRIFCYNASEKVYDGCTHLDLYLRSIFPHTLLYWIFWMLPAAITTLLSDAITSQYPSIRIFSWVLVGTWTPSAIYMLFCRDHADGLSGICYVFGCNRCM